ncbi:unnamed protein product [Choristocarpus tenellus]
MWKLLSSAGITPQGFTAVNDDDCPIECGVGFTDLGYSEPGTDSSAFKKDILHGWRKGFYDRLEAHVDRAAATVAASSASVLSTSSRQVTDFPPAKRMLDGQGENEEGDETTAPKKSCQTFSPINGFPKVVAFSGKRQWEELFFDAPNETKSKLRGGQKGPFSFGLQPASIRPPGWPFPSKATDVFVLCSSSGAAALTNSAREGPYNELGAHLARWEWRRKRTCHQQIGGASHKF